MSEFELYAVEVRIKSLKRRAFGFRNMDYFRLKIMQVCGYLNSRHIKFAEILGT